VQKEDGPPGTRDIVGLTPDAALARLGINLEKMTPGEQMAMKMKLKRVLGHAQENRKLEEEVFRLHGILEGTSLIPPNTPLLVKIFDDINKETTILRISSSDSADKVADSITDAIGRFGLLLITSHGKNLELNDENLQQEQQALGMGEASAMVILAL
jgi:hypothetical protein